MTDMQTLLLRWVEKHCTSESGYCTVEIAAMVARQPGHESNRQHSALIQREMRALEAMRLVHRLDTKLPIVWCRGE
jgi:hypothetical protein